MANTFHLTISTVGETKFDGAAVSATFPGIDGEFTVLPNHEPFVTTLKPGIISVHTEGDGVKEFQSESGLFECSGNRAVVLL